MTTKISGSQITDFTIQTTQLSNTAVASFAVALAPKVRYANVANSAFSVLDDTAVNVGGGYIVVTGSDFVSGAQVLIDTTPASAVTFVNSTTLQVQVPTKAAASYNLYVVNPDGGVGVKVSGLTYSVNPTWVTSSPLANQASNTSFAVALSATGANTYSVASGSSLPAGTSLLANGYFYGTVSISTETVYSFVIRATDTELQDADKTFGLTVTVTPTDPQFSSVILLLQGDGVANNGTITCATANNTLTISGDARVRTDIYKYGTGSIYFDGDGDRIIVNSSPGKFVFAGDYTIEFWIYSLKARSAGGPNYGVFDFGYSQGTGGIRMNIVGLDIYWYVNGYGIMDTATPTNWTGNWHHIAFTKSGTNGTLWVNGEVRGYNTTFPASSAAKTMLIGAASASDPSPYIFQGFMDDFRVSDYARYTQNTIFTPPTVKFPSA